LTGARSDDVFIEVLGAHNHDEPDRGQKAECHNCCHRKTPS
jgi:hypothetical protein